MRDLLLAVAAVVVAAVVNWSCGVCTLGTEGCGCTSDGTCGPGLNCLSGSCLAGPGGNDHVTILPAGATPQSALPGACTDPSGLNGAKGVLHIGGHQDCDLTIDPVTYEATGKCERLTIGIVRPLMLVFHKEPPASEPKALLSIHIGTVDLTRGAVPASGEIDLGSAFTGPGSVTAYSEAEINSFPDASATVTTDLDKAKQWARFQYDILASNGYSFDVDADSCANLVEACELTLYVAGNTTCP